MLGNPTTFTSGADACKAADAAFVATKAKLAQTTKIDVAVDSPDCAIGLDEYGECAAHCDATVHPGAANLQCDGALEGHCTGECTGTCRDGGTTSNARACGGTCSGSCSTPMASAKCVGRVKSPSVQGDCQTRCDARAQVKMVCTPPHVDVAVHGAASEAAALKKAIEKGLPRLVEVGKGMGTEATRIAGNVKDLVSGTEALVKVVVGGNKAMGALLSACVGPQLAGSLAAAADITTNIDVSVEVTASITGDHESSSPAAPVSSR